MSEKETIAYLAGIIDGEGFIEIRKVITSKGNFCYSARMSFFMTNKTPADLFSQIFGSKVLCTKMKRKEYYGIAVGGKNLKPILVKLLPYLRVRKQVALYALELIKNRKEFPVHPIFENGKFRGTQEIPKKIQQKREHLFVLCSSYQKQRGQGIEDPEKFSKRE